MNQVDWRCVDSLPNVSKKLAEMIEMPGVIVETLATALPAEATYFLQFSFVSTVSTFAFEGLRLFPIGMAIVRSFIGPRLTDKEKQTTYLGMAPVCNPAPFMHAYYTSMLVSKFVSREVLSCCKQRVIHSQYLWVKFRYSTLWYYLCTQ